MVQGSKPATVARKTNETDIHVNLTLDQYDGQRIEINTGVGFLDHVRIIVWRIPDRFASY